MFINKQKGETKPYYSVLIDHRDYPFIVSHKTYVLRSCQYQLHGRNSACMSQYTSNYSLCVPLLAQQSHPEAITFLGDENDVSLYSIPGMMIHLLHVICHVCLGYLPTSYIASVVHTCISMCMWSL